MFLNVSNKKQCVINYMLDYGKINPNEVVSSNIYPNIDKLDKYFKKINKIDFTKSNKILLKRNHALGDVLMTLPIINYLTKIGKKVDLSTNFKYLIPGIGFIKEHREVYPEDYDLIIDLDLVVEQDHWDETLFRKNRVDIFKDYLSLGDIGNDWHLDFKKEEIDNRLYKDCIGIQLSGSQKHKSINLMPLLEELDKRKIKVFLISPSVEGKISYKNIIRDDNKSLIHLLNILSKLKGVLTFDSGVLWLSHVTNTPSFTIIGPTCGDKIISRHPCEKSTYYDTKIDSKCRLIYGCGESAKDCNKEFKCLNNINQNKFIHNFVSWIDYLN